MSVATAVKDVSTLRGFQVSRRALWIAWLFAGLSLFCFLGNPPVQRTQEARVLETARQMRGTGWRGWVIPKINGSLRLQKPPLAYWAAATAYDLTGNVSNAIGRAPTALFGWLTIGATFAIAAGIFDRRAGFYSAGCLLCSYLFFRHDRLAETDAPAALFVTLAVWAWWQAVERGRSRHSALLFNLGAVATALAVMFKGGPGAFPPLFLLGFICLRRRWEALGRFLKSGALLVLLALAAPWFLYTYHVAHTRQFGGEVDDLFSGNDHYAPAWNYAHLVLRGAMPWLLLVPAGLVMAVWPVLRPSGSRSQAWRHWADSAPAGVLVWAAAVLVPLCAIGNKQFHYLLPLMPPLMILVGWVMSEATAEDHRVAPLLGAIVDATFLLLPPIAIALVIGVGWKTAGHVRPMDWALAAGVAIALACVLTAYGRRGRAGASIVFLFGCGMLFPFMVGVWMPSLEPDNPTVLARRVRDRFGEGPYAFYGYNYSLPLCFNLRSAIPVIHTAPALEAALASHPDLVVIAQTKNHHPPPALPPGVVRVMKQNEPGQVFEFYQKRQIHGEGAKGRG